MLCNCPERLRETCLREVCPPTEGLTEEERKRIRGEAPPGLLVLVRTPIDFVPDPEPRRELPKQPLAQFSHYEIAGSGVLELWQTLLGRW